MVPNSQDLFAFTWNNQQCTWPVTPQRFTEAPSHFSQELHQDVSTLQTLGNQPSYSTWMFSAMLSYQRDAPIYGFHLFADTAEKGHKVPKEKLQ